MTRELAQDAEAARLLELARYRILDSLPEPDFDDLTHLVARVCGVPVAFVSFVSDEREWIKSRVGIDLEALPRPLSFGVHAIAQEDLLVLEDASRDARFATHPLVTGGPSVRLYAAVPIRSAQGHALGTLSIMDRVPRQLGPEERDTLVVLAHQISHLLELRRNASELRQTADERTGVQQALVESEERYRGLFEGSNDLIHAATPDGRLLYTNRAWRDTLRYTEAEIDKLSVFDVIHEDNRSETADLFQWVLEGGDVDTAQLVLVSKDRRPIVAEGSLSCRRVDGRPVAIRAILRDATERRRAEERLRASEARTRSIIENMLGGLITLDAQGRIESINPAGEVIFGYRADELVGQHLGVLLPDSKGQDKAAYLQSAFPKAIGRLVEWQGRRKNGETFPFELSMFEFETDAGKRLAGNMRDVSERQEVERLKKEFVSTVSHELRTPLTSIRGSLSLLAAGVLGELPAEAQEGVEIAERNAVRLIGLINDILDLERLESGRMDMHMSEVAADDVLRRSAEAIKGVAEQQGIAIEILAQPLRMWADPDRLVQVVVNLAGNAIKFSPKGQTVTLQAEELPPYVELRVIDRGRGIPPAYREAVFERFKQVEASDAREKGGTGLGLAICKAIVERHNGEIGVSSEEGRGSTFYFRIPVVAAAPGEQQVQAS